MTSARARSRASVALLCGLLLVLGTSCSASGGGEPGRGGEATGPPAPSPSVSRELPGVGARMAADVPASSRQALVVYGEGPDSADAELVLYSRTGKDWTREHAWPAHNGKKGWTPDHHEGDKRSPVGVFTLTDAGGVLPDPGALLPYTSDAAFAAPRYWPRTHHHDFDYVIAIDYNRVKGTPPNDPTRPEGQSRGGSIWLHMDHGSGTSACVSVSKAAMASLLRTLDPADRPVIVMGDRARLAA